MTGVCHLTYGKMATSLRIFLWYNTKNRNIFQKISFLRFTLTSTRFFNNPALFFNNLPLSFKKDRSLNDAPTLLPRKNYQRGNVFAATSS